MDETTGAPSGPGDAADAATTQGLARRALAWDAAALPAEARRIAVHCIVDWYAVTLAGAADPAVRVLLDDALAEGGNPVATAAGSPRRLGMYGAALVNGTAAHLLDYDDVNLAITGHPTAVVYSALLPLAESLRAGGAELLSAFVAGYETACRVGRWLGDAHYERGYHATATVGAVAAAAACARLLRLDAGRAAAALSLAATQAGGLKAMFGTMGKPLHAGLAARNGLTAACLAARGFDGGGAALEAPQGYAAVLSPAPDAAACRAGAPRGLYLYDRLFKYHAACYGTHAGIECARDIARNARFLPEEVDAIHVAAHASARKMCSIPAPATPNEARFSMALNVAFGLLGLDTADAAAYTPGRLADPRVVALRDKVAVDYVEDVAMMESAVELRLRNGTVLRARRDAGVAEPDVGREESRLRAKFTALAGPVLGAQRAAGLLESLFALPSCADASALARPLAAAGAPA